MFSLRDFVPLTIIFSSNKLSMGPGGGVFTLESDLTNSSHWSYQCLLRAYWYYESIFSFS